MASTMTHHGHKMMKFHVHNFGKSKRIEPRQISYAIGLFGEISAPEVETGILIGDFGEEYITTHLDNFKIGIFGELEVAVKSSFAIGDFGELSQASNNLAGNIGCFGESIVSYKEKGVRIGAFGEAIL